MPKPIGKLVDEVASHALSLRFAPHLTLERHREALTEAAALLRAIRELIEGAGE